MNTKCWNILGECLVVPSGESNVWKASMRTIMYVDLSLLGPYCNKKDVPN